MFGTGKSALDLQKITKELCKPESYSRVFVGSRPADMHMPSLDELKLAVEMLRSILFPGYYMHPEMREDSMEYYIGSTLDQCHAILTEQLRRGHCFSCGTEALCDSCAATAAAAADRLFERLPEIRRLLVTDAEAAYDGDPAARSIGETIFCYPSIRALTNHRIAHELYKLNVPIIPRLISELAHGETGIDIHPGATIGERFSSTMERERSSARPAS
jgi:serine O-acetyltransferase